MKHFGYVQCKQKGQIILILIMVMTVALGIGLSIVQKSLVDLSTASKVEQSSRAFSAAEAGIEKALQQNSLSGTLIQGQPLGNLSSFNDVVDSGLIPAVPTSGRQTPLEYPPLAKEETAHVWLAALNSDSNPPAPFYTRDTLDVYWGSTTVSERAALELTLVYFGTDSNDPDDPLTPKYRSRKWYLDNASAGRSNGFEQISCPGYKIGTNNYLCRKTIGATPDLPLQSGLMLLRARLLYNDISQPFAVHAVGVCGKDCSLPPQAKEIISTGIAGETQRQVKVFQMDKVVPPFFDYAIFSAGEISKQ